MAKAPSVPGGKSAEILEVVPLTEEEIEKIAGEKNVHSGVDSTGPNTYLVEAVSDLNKNPSALDFYRQVILGENQEYLKMATKEKIARLESMQPNLRGAFKKGFYGMRDLILSKRKRTDFKVFTSSLQPVRRDSNFTIEGEFRSPFSLGLQNGTGGYDTPVLASHYVYGTFDEVSHPMGSKLPNVDERAQDKGYYYLDKEDIKERAEIVMMDIADVQVCTNKLGKSAILTYLDNLFDYEGGKEVLALYLAYVFEDLAEAQKFLSENCTRYTAESWYKGYGPNRFGTHPLDYDDGSQFKYIDAEGKRVEFAQDTTGRLKRIQKRMREVFDATGILPPLELEIRVRDYAKIKRH